MGEKTFHEAFSCLLNFNCRYALGNNRNFCPNPIRDGIRLHGAGSPAFLCHPYRHGDLSIAFQAGPFPGSVQRFMVFCGHRDFKHSFFQFLLFYNHQPNFPCHRFNPSLYGPRHCHASLPFAVQGKDDGFKVYFRSAGFSWLCTGGRRQPADGPVRYAGGISDRSRCGVGLCALQHLWAVCA